jgi:hypothetical protein
MSKVIQAKGYRYYDKKILGYRFGVLELSSGWITFRAPMGEGRDKEMFDSLVYFHPKVYQGKIEDKKKIISGLKAFIKQY